MVGQPAVEGYVEVPGGRVWYRIAGADQPGTPLPCLYGGPGMPHDYLEPREGLRVVDDFLTRIEAGERAAE